MSICNVFIKNSKVIGDNRGNLISLEQLSEEVPFNIQRVYYIYNTNEERRGFHAHKDLQQILVCVSGSCKIHCDNAFETEEYTLDDPSKLLYIGNDVWREMYDFSKDCVLMVLASKVYNEDDYIRNYNDFVSYRKGD